MSKRKSHAHVEHQVKEKKVKSTSLKKIKPKILVDAPEEHYFILCNGQPVKNVKELADALETLEENVFNHHVTFERNDFATWINDVFHDVELANKIAGTKDRGNTRIILYKHIVDRINK